jgi:hypothetical protein
MEEMTTVVYYETVLWVAGIYSVANFIKWLYPILCKLYEFIFKKLGVTTKGMRKREANEKRLENTEKSIAEIVDKIEAFKNEIVAELNRLQDKVDEQKVEMDETKRANDKTDCAMLRDRIGSGMRYFSKNIAPDGKVHISWSDWENMNALFQEYFSKHGNGAFRKMYDDEFVHFIIDR